MLLILAILVAMIVSVVGLVQRTSQRQRAETDANALVQAVLHYRQVYGAWPADPTNRTGTNTFFLAGCSNQAQFFAGAGLLAADIDQAAVIVALVNNPRRIPFLGMPTNAWNACGQLVDPWGHPYLLVLDAQQTVFQLGDLAFSNLPAFAISAGAPVANPTVSNWIFSAGVRP